MACWGSKNVVESEAERDEINRLFFEWSEKTFELLRSKAVSLSQFLDAIPEPWRSGLIDDLLHEIERQKSFNKTDSQTTP